MARYPEATVQYLIWVYAGGESDMTLPNCTGRSYRQLLDDQYRAFLQGLDDKP